MSSRRRRRLERQGRPSVRHCAKTSWFRARHLSPARNYCEHAHDLVLKLTASATGDCPNVPSCSARFHLFTVLGVAIPAEPLPDRHAIKSAALSRVRVFGFRGWNLTPLRQSANASLRRARLLSSIGNERRRFHGLPLEQVALLARHAPNDSFFRFWICLHGVPGAAGLTEPQPDQLCFRH
jgi:hypothetical protein